MFKSINIVGFRGIKEAHFPNLRKLNLLVGRNNSGKTSILESLFIISNPAASSLIVRTNNARSHVIVDHSGWTLFFNNLKTDRPIEISADLLHPDETRILRIKPHHVPHNQTMVLDQTKGSVSTPANTEDGLDFDFEILPQKDGPRKKYHASIGIGKVEETAEGPAGTPIKVPQLAVSTPKDYEEKLVVRFLTSSTLATGVVAAFDQVQQEKRIPEVIRVLQHIEPKLQNLVLTKEGYVNADIGLDRLIPINMMGDGMFRLLGIVLAMAISRNGVVLIDELETGFHATSQRIMWEAIIRFSQEFNTQVIATTHSMECVRAFAFESARIPAARNEAAVIRIESHNDGIKPVYLDHADLELALERGWEFR